MTNRSRFRPAAALGGGLALIAQALLMPGAAAASPPVQLASVMFEQPAMPAASESMRPQVEQIMALLRKKQFDQALRQATQLTQAHPTNSAGPNLQGAAHLGRNDLPSARRSFEQALRTSPGDETALMNLAQLDLRADNRGDARRRYEAILSRSPGHLMAMLGMARVATAEDKHDEALDWLRQGRTAAPDALPVRLLLADSLISRGEHAEAIVEMTEAQRAHPDHPNVLDLLGRAQLGAGRAKDAVASYSRLAEVQPKSATARFRLAGAQTAVNDYDAAQKSLRTAVELEPRHVEAQAALGALELSAGKPADAMRRAEQVQKLAPKAPLGFVLAGDTHLVEKRYSQAIQAYEKGWTLGVSGPLAVKLHSARSAAGQTKTADTKLLEWLKAHPGDTSTRDYLAGNYARSGRNMLAIEEYERVLRDDPKRLITLNNLALAYQREQDPRALETAELAYKLAPDVPAVANTLGSILVERGQTARGLELLRKAAGGAPDNPEVRYNLAVALAKSGDKAGARGELERLLAGSARFPQREAAKGLLKGL